MPEEWKSDREVLRAAFDARVLTSFRDVPPNMRSDREVVLAGLKIGVSNGVACHQTGRTAQISLWQLGKHGDIALSDAPLLLDANCFREALKQKKICLG